MDYELAQKLRNAGFSGMVNAWFDPNSNCISSAPVEGWEMRWFMPSLSELIKECGDDFGGLMSVPIAPETTERGFCAFKTSLIKETTIEAKNYKTPEEAVANLWFALHAH